MCYTRPLSQVSKPGGPETEPSLIAMILCDVSWKEEGYHAPKCIQCVLLNPKMTCSLRLSFKEILTFSSLIIQQPFKYLLTWF